MHAVLPVVETTPAEPGDVAHPAWVVVCAVTGGALTSTAFPDRGWWPLAFVGVALLVLASRGLGVAATSLIWFAWALAFFVPHLAWAREAAGPSAWAALAVLEAAVLAGVGVGWALARRAAFLARRPGLRATTFAAVWVTGEQLRSVAPFGGFPWGRLAFSQVDGPLLPLASMVGAPGVSFAVALVGAQLALAVLAVRRRETRRVVAAIATSGVVLVGSSLLPLPTQRESGDLRVGAVQGDVPARPGPDRARQVLDNHVAGTRDLAATRSDPVDLVVWPENATDVDPRTDPGAAGQVQAAAESAGAPVLLGAMRSEPGARYNEMLVWDPESGPTASYTKQRPAPFGEYIPLRSYVRLLSSAVDRVPVDVVPGDAPALLPVPVARLSRDVLAATVICFEVAFDDVVRDAVRRGAELLVVPTNNASFGRTAQSTQQLAMSRLRAVEHGRATIQVSTVGISAVIAPDGGVLDRTALFTADTLSTRLPLRTSLTLSDRLGDAPTTAAVLIALVASIAGLRATFSRRPTRGRVTQEGLT